MHLKHFLIGLITHVLCQMEVCIAERVSYIATERPTVTYFDKKFVTNVIIISRRYSRKDPLYYIHVYIETVVTMGNNASIDFYFYKFQNNRYCRTFIEMHFRICDFAETGTLFGKSLKNALLNKVCPFPPGHHHFANLTLPLKSIPTSFPYRQGRLFCNMSIEHDGIITSLVEGFIDLEVKVANGNKIIKLK